MASTSTVRLSARRPPRTAAIILRNPRPQIPAPAGGAAGLYRKWHPFDGYVEQMTNDQPYRPRGKFRAASNSGKWSTRLGCVRVNAFSGVTRGQLLASFAASAGVTISNLATTAIGREVQKPVDESGITVFDLIKKWGEIEGWYARLSTDGASLEILKENAFITGTPAFAFDESNYMGITEEPPARPVTDWILSGWRMHDVSLKGLVTTTAEDLGTNAAGGKTLTRVTVTTDHGAEVYRKQEYWDTIATPATTAFPITFQPVRIEEIVTVWDPYAYTDSTGISQTRPSTRLNTRLTTVRELTGTPAAIGYGNLWNNGGRFLETSADAYILNAAAVGANLATSLTLTSRVTETYVWNTPTSVKPGAAACTLRTAQIKHEALFSPAPFTGEAGYIYQDGSLHHDPSYTFRLVDQHDISWTDDRIAEQNPSVLYTDTFQILSWNWIGGTPTGQLTPAQITSRKFEPGIGGSSYILTEEIRTFGQNPMPGQPANGITKSVTTVAGIMPGPPIGSTTVPIIVQVPMILEYNATAPSGYTRYTGPPQTINFAEDEEELKTWARRRLRRDHAITLKIDHRAISGLRVGDHVSVTNRARNLTAKDAYVWDIRRTLLPVNGSFKQTTTIKIPPSWI